MLGIQIQHEMAVHIHWIVINIAGMIIHELPLCFSKHPKDIAARRTIAHILPQTVRFSHEADVHHLLSCDSGRDNNIPVCERAQMNPMNHLRPLCILLAPRLFE